MNRRKYKKDIRTEIYGLENKLRVEEKLTSRLYAIDNTVELLRQKHQLYNELMDLSREKVREGLEGSFEDENGDEHNDKDDMDVESSQSVE